MVIGVVYLDPHSPLDIYNIHHMDPDLVYSEINRGKKDSSIFG